MAASLIATSAERAMASDAAALLGGAILGGIIVNEVNKNKQRQRAATTTRRTTSSQSSAQRQENRDVQTSLNHFGYHVGTVDGSLGSRSRAAISQYQADMGYTVDGYLDGYEKDFLLSSYQRALATQYTPPYNQILATQGQRGLLRTFRNEQMGIATQMPQQPAGVQTAAVTTTPMPVPVQPQVQQPQPPQPQPVATRSDGALPSFTFGQVDRSTTDHCNEISVLTAANGGVTTAGRVSDASFALNEQFCLARTHAMAESARIEATIPNLNADQILAQCQGLTQALAPKLANLSTDRPERVIADTANFLRDSGKPMDQLASGGKVCLGVGYRIDDPQMAVASAVLLTAAGQLGYGEAVAHHLREGFGVAQAQPQLAADWMKMSLNAVKNGGALVLGQSPDRLAVLNEAVSGSSGAGGLPAFPAAASN
jgi:peptidoglycan hydrolase-like protein with peptidoglycan-binding domain